MGSILEFRLQLIAVATEEHLCATSVIRCALLGGAVRSSGISKAPASHV